MVLARPDAEDEGMAAIMRRSRFIYLAGSSPMHLRSVLKHSTVWEALVAAWQDGAVVAGSSGAAMALTDPMVDARGGGLTIGLGLLGGVAVVPHFGDVAEDVHGEKLHRAVLLAPAGTPWPGSPSAPRSSASRTANGTTPGWAGWPSSSTGPGRRPGSTLCQPEKPPGRTPEPPEAGGAGRSVGFGDGHRFDDDVLRRCSRPAAHRLDGRHHVEAAHDLAEQ